MKHVHRVNCQPQRFYFALPWPEMFAQHALDFGRIFLDLVLILSFFPIAIEEGPGQPLFNICTSDIFNVCTLEPASNVLLRVCHLGLEQSKSLRRSSLERGGGWMAACRRYHRYGTKKQVQKSASAISQSSIDGLMRNIVAESNVTMTQYRMLKGSTQ
jgi:hypothetical protein